MDAESEASMLDFEVFLARPSFSLVFSSSRSSSSWKDHQYEDLAYTVTTVPLGISKVWLVEYCPNVKCG
jgi:hypothetical protein